MSKPKTHPTVGRQFKGHDGAIYLCTRYLRRAGFDMRVVGHGKNADSHTRAIGETCNVSEMAIVRTFHVNWDIESVAHEDGCECYMCFALKE